MDINRAYKKHNSLSQQGDGSLGILNKEKLQVFSDTSHDSSKNENYPKIVNNSGRVISDRLNKERMKALEALQKSQNNCVAKRSYSVSNKEINEGATNVSSEIPTIHIEHTDYVPFRRPNAINISELVTDETINLERSSSCVQPAGKDDKVSFEPTEITGRSTLYNKENTNYENVMGGALGAVHNKVHKAKNVSVSDILASSFAPKARNLCDSLQGTGDTTLDCNLRHDHAISSSATTSFLSFNGCKSLAQTADMSLSKSVCTEESFKCDIRTCSSISAGIGTGLDESELFAPGELMQSKLINDEISWAQEYAAIPTAALSEQAKAKVLRNAGSISNEFESPTNSNSMIAGDPNFSVGNFFNMRSDNIWNIVKSKSPDKCRRPVALVDNEDNAVTTTTLLDADSKVSVTPKIDNKTYTRLGTFTTEKNSFTKPIAEQASKDCGNSTDNSYLLSISAIDRALCNLDIPSDASGIGVSQQLLVRGKNSKACANRSYESDKKEINSLCSKQSSFATETKINGIEKIIGTDQMILENKENLDPRSISTLGATTLGDTMSFNESLLNTSDTKKMQHSYAHPRSPLSPIDVRVPNIRISLIPDGGEEADNDEWPDTPIASNRRIRRTKSPKVKSPLQNDNVSNENITDATTPVNSRPSCACTLENKKKLDTEPKTMSSTRIDGVERNPHSPCDFGISPNISNSRHSTSALVPGSTNTVYFPKAASPKITSPSHTDNSPMSSPHAYHLSQMKSPTPTAIEFPSPNFDATSPCDRQLLSTRPIKKVMGSPAGSESSSACSYGTVQTYRSCMSRGSGRSVSRCSSSSEFSHRDGKQIPLKVTNTELSWGSIKLRSNCKKSMQIKNISNKRLVIRIEISGPGYQIVNSQRSNSVTLHSQECRTISICFCPTVRGVAIGRLSFYAPCGVPAIGNSFLDVPLYGYGGNASIIAQNISNGPVGSPFVTLGDVCELSHPLERTVSFYNKGPLLGFASVTIDSIGLMVPRISDAFEIQPRIILIPPKNVVNIRVIFRPKREEIKKIVRRLGNVLTLANMRVICGDEANRQRIRRLLFQMPEEERRKFSSRPLDMLWTKFPHEMEITDLNDIRESPSIAMDLTSYFRIHEILLTINHHNMDDTFESSLFLADVDETVLFRTVCATVDSPTPLCNLETVDENFEELNEEAVTKPTKRGSWSVSPETLVIDLNKQEPVTLRVHNEFKSRQFFDVISNFKEAFYFAPNDGYVAPEGGQAQINISLHEQFQCPSENVYIMVCMENERIMVPVKFIK